MFIKCQTVYEVLKIQGWWRCFPCHPWTSEEDREKRKRRQEEWFWVFYVAACLFRRATSVMNSLESQRAGSSHILLAWKALSPSDGIDSQWVDKGSQAVSPGQCPVIGVFMLFPTPWTRDTWDLGRLVSSYIFFLFLKKIK